jgi:hypothetical protein
VAAVEVFSLHGELVEQKRTQAEGKFLKCKQIALTFNECFPRPLIVGSVS